MGTNTKRVQCYNEYYLNVKALNESGTTEEDIQQKAQVMYKEVQTTIFDKAGNPNKNHRFDLCIVGCI